jgi:hypothetical protein
MIGTIELDGRKFLGITKALTSEQDTYILAHLRLAGAIEVMNDRDGVKRSKEKRAEDLLTQLMLSGETYLVLAGCLTEDGKVWSRAEADANAARFAAITDVSEKAEMRNSIVQVVIGFFDLGATASESSQEPSSQGEKGHA